MMWTLLATVLVISFVWAVIRPDKDPPADDLSEYMRGFDACSRIRDRVDVQERKQALLSLTAAQQHSLDCSLALEAAHVRIRALQEQLREQGIEVQWPS